MMMDRIGRPASGWMSTAWIPMPKAAAPTTRNPTTDDGIATRRRLNRTHPSHIAPMVATNAALPAAMAHHADESKVHTR